jgi:hypothetical protein
MRIERLIKVIVVLAFAMSVSVVETVGAEVPPAETASSGEQTIELTKDAEPAKPEKKAKFAEKKKDNDLDRQLLRDLLPDLPLDLDSPRQKTEAANAPPAEPQSRIPFADELDEAVAAMREVSQRLGQLNRSEDTEQLQEGIVTNIDALIEKLKNLPPPSSSSSSENSDKDPSDSDSTSQGQKQGPKPKPQQAPQKQNAADSAAGGAPQSKTGKAGESTEQNLRQARERAAALARRRALIDEVWGHLPPAMRERLLNVGSEKLLPKYEDLIRRYYEALAEPDKSGSRR